MQAFAAFSCFFTVHDWLTKLHEDIAMYLGRESNYESLTIPCFFYVVFLSFFCFFVLTLMLLLHSISFLFCCPAP